MTRHSAMWVLSLLVLVVAAPKAHQKAPKPIPPGPIAPLDVTHLLDTYAAGRFDEAVGAVAQVGDEIGRNLRRHWMVDAPLWIDADPADRRRRLLVAAALALETERVRVERGDWRVFGDPACSGACVLDWAQAQLVARGAPDRAEHAWYLAAAALVGGVRDWTYLYRPIAPQARRPGDSSPWPPPPTLLDRALTRFPGDPPLLLERAMAAAGPLSVTFDDARLTPDGGYYAALPNRPARDAAIEMLEGRVDDPGTGAEASLRLGYLRWALGQREAANADLARAAAVTSDADLRYLAKFLLGWTALIRNDADAAIPHLRAALEARPDSQSAAVALASLELQRGDATAAFAIAQASLDKRATDDDPWRLFLYAHYPKLPALIADLRRQVRP